MPFMGGMEATELIRSYELHHGLPRTPIIALTAHASELPMISYMKHALNVYLNSDW